MLDTWVPALSAAEAGLSLGSGCELSAHLLPELPHRGDLTRIATFRPGFEALCCFFQVFEELSIDEALASLRNRGLNAFPNAEKFAAGFEEQFFVQQTVIEQRAGLLPIADHHHEGCARFRSHRGDFHGLVESVR